MIDVLRARAVWIERHVLPHEPRIRAWLVRHRVSNVEVDDVIQEMYAKLSSLETYENIRDPRHYALRVAQSILLGQLRRRKIVSILPVENIECFEIASSTPSPEDAALHKDEIRQLADALAELPERTREVLILRRVRGMSQRETANHLSMSEKMVEKRLARAIQMLMNYFGQGGKKTSRASDILTDHKGRERDDVPSS